MPTRHYHHGGASAVVSQAACHGCGQSASVTPWSWRAFPEGLGSVLQGRNACGATVCHAGIVADYEIVIHLRDSAEPLRVPLPGVSEHDAEAEREALIYDLDEARLAEVPLLAVQTKKGFPRDPLPLDPHRITEIDLIEMSAPEQ